jgi:hypothetical protein
MHGYLLEVHFNTDALDGVGILLLLLSVLCLFLGLIFVFIRTLRNAGKKLLLAGGLMLLIGFSICSRHL